MNCPRALTTPMHSCLPHFIHPSLALFSMVRESFRITSISSVLYQRDSRSNSSSSFDMLQLHNHGNAVSHLDFTKVTCIASSSLVVSAGSGLTSTAHVDAFYMSSHASSGPMCDSELSWLLFYFCDNVVPILILVFWRVVGLLAGSL